MRLRGFVPIEDLAVVSVRPSGHGAADDDPDRRDPAGRRRAPDLREPPPPPVPPSVPPAVLGDVTDWAARTSLFGEGEG
jgi:hypothetical protein